MATPVTRRSLTYSAVCRLLSYATTDYGTVLAECKQQGNACYKKKQYEQAVQHYMHALDKSPFNVAVLANLAQTSLRLEHLDDAVEFSTRALFIHPQHVKALSRRAAALYRQKQWKDAAADVEKALGLEPGNADLVEQHSVIVGDYEDALAESELSAALALKRATNDDERVSVEELRFVADLLKRMNESLPAGDDDNQVQDEAESERDTGHDTNKSSLVKPAWVAYELLLPFLERNESVRTFVRTSGELTKLCDRLADITEPETFVKTLRDDTDQQLIVTAMINCVAAAIRSCSRNQVVTFQHVRFRKHILGVLEDMGRVGDCDRIKAESTVENAATAVPWSTLASVLRFVDEAVELKSWKRAVGSSQAVVRTLLALLQSPPAIVTTTASGHTSPTISSQVPTPLDLQSLQHTVLAASGICFTISGDDHGLREFAHDAVKSVQVAAAALSHWQRLDARAVPNLLGFITNLSTVDAFRAALELPAAMCDDRPLALCLTRDLLDIASSGVRQASAVDVSCAERALAALLNLSFDPTSRIRHALFTGDTVTTLEIILSVTTLDNCEQLQLIHSRAVSLLCRLHAVAPIDAVFGSQDLNYKCVMRFSPEALHTVAQLTHRNLLELLYQTCRQTLSTTANSSNADTSRPSEAWQLSAHIWCHVGWCARDPSVRSFLREKCASSAMLQAIALANGQAASGYRGPDASARERLVGNMVKVLIALHADCATQDTTVFATNASLKTLVEALKRLPDGPARKNVAVLLAKLCQNSDPSVKETVRALRGIEMMLTVSQSLEKRR